MTSNNVFIGSSDGNHSQPENGLKDESTQKTDSQREKRKSIVIERWKRNLDLLLPVGNDPIHDNMVEALTIAFDIPEHLDDLMEDLTNRDLIWIPEPLDDESEDKLKWVNYFQLPSQESNHRDPILNTFCCLFSSCEPYWREPYNFHNKIIKMRLELHKLLKNTYNNSAQEYIKYVANTLCMSYKEIEDHVSKVQRCFDNVK